jgi:uncharacterized membrane protein YvlD (DUF360 family)
MTYLRSLFLNFLAVFFINHVNPGINIKTFEHVPNIGADILFAVIVGFLSASIFPCFVLFDIKPKIVWMVVIAFLISFLSYGIVAIFDLGVEVRSFAGFFISFLIVGTISSFSNFLEYKHSYKGK